MPRFFPFPFQRSLLLPLVASLGLSAGTASALQIEASDLPSLATEVDLGFALVKAKGGPFIHENTGGFLTAGISGGLEGGEIDLAMEAIVFKFTEPQIVTELVLGNLFAAGEHDDIHDEKALVRVNFAAGGSAAYVLELNGGLAASFTGGATVTTVSPGLFGSAGVFAIANPFGSAAVTSVTLLAVGSSTPQDMRNNDYGFVSLEATVVPEPSSLALVCIGLTGLLVAGRRR